MRQRDGKGENPGRLHLLLSVLHDHSAARAREVLKPSSVRNESLARRERARPHHNRAEPRQVRLGKLRGRKHRYFHSKLREHWRNVVADAVDVRYARLCRQLRIHGFQPHACSSVIAERTDVRVLNRHVPNDELLGATHRLRADLMCTCRKSVTHRE